MPFLRGTKWHPEQRESQEGDSFILEFPYADDRELIMDIMRFGPWVEVMEPKELRHRVAEYLNQAAKQYQEE